jgi:TonB family protein
MRLKLVSLICLGIFSAIQVAPAQERTTAKLNRHFIEIQKDDTKNHQYNKVETISASGETVTWIFDLQNRMVKQSKKSINAEGNFNQEISETFDSANHLVSQRITNLDNTKYVEFFYRDGVKKAQVTHLGNDVFEIWRNHPDSVYTADHNDFGPGIKKKEWQNFLMHNLKYPIEARRIQEAGTVILSVLIDQNGQIKNYEVANESFVNQYLVKEVLRIAKLFKGSFSPALNLDGLPVEVWINIPVRFQLG